MRNHYEYARSRVLMPQIYRQAYYIDKNLHAKITTPLFFSVSGRQGNSKIGYFIVASDSARHGDFEIFELLLLQYVCATYIKLSLDLKNPKMQENH